MVSLARALNVILGLSLLGSVSYLSWLYWAPHYQLPVQYLNATVINSPVNPGEPVIIVMTLNRKKNCSGSVNRFLYRILDDKPTLTEEIVYRDTVQWAATVIGDNISVKFTVPLPATAMPGNYVYHSIVRYDCSDNIFTIDAPRAQFQVR